VTCPQCRRGNILGKWGREEENMVGGEGSGVGRV